jgi:hypothetical protein
MRGLFLPINQLHRVVKGLQDCYGRSRNCHQRSLQGNSVVKDELARSSLSAMFLKREKREK